jgi:hypothetical protein
MMYARGMAGRMREARLGDCASLGRVVCVSLGSAECARLVRAEARDKAGRCSMQT